MTKNETIGADNEGDVFVNGYDGNEFGVVEYPVRKCKRKVLNLQPEIGYPGDVGIDPKTEDLIVVDDPGACAGGPITARMTILSQALPLDELYAHTCASPGLPKQIVGILKELKSGMKAETVCHKHGISGGTLYN